MRLKKSEIEIPLSGAKGVNLCVYGENNDTLCELDKEVALEKGESEWQLLEGHFYQYYFTKNGVSFNEFQLRENVVIKHLRKKNVSEGRISPNIYVGSLEVIIFDKTTQKEIQTIYLEVIPTKLDAESNRNEDSSYRENYEYMLGDIAEICTELLLQIDSPVYQNFEVDFEKDPKVTYQRFAFIKALLNSNEFNEAVHKIISMPVSKWAVENEQSDIRSIRRINGRAVSQLVTGSNRIKLKNPIGDLKSVPVKIESYRKVETFDTHENRFVKHALETFLQFVKECENSFKLHKYEKSRMEALSMGELLESHLNHPFFKDIGNPTTLKLNSPALQRKSGYREVLNAWLKFDLSLRLIWQGGDDVYKAGKRDIAVLYEYWLFFQLYDLIREKFKINSIEHGSGGDIKNYNHLITKYNDDLLLMVKSGKFTALEGLFKSDGWEFNVKFNYNKTFSTSRDYADKKQGSWTKPLRPDYTLSIWPKIFSEIKAEEKEQIVHIHFDAKYKVQHFVIPKAIEENLKDADSVTDEDEHIDSLQKEKRDELRGVYKNADLMKMHAYKDAIRRTGGAYIIYPGTENQVPLRGFHEIIPGLGAFSIFPSKEEKENGIRSLSEFIDKVIENFKNSASQQKKSAAKAYEIYEKGPSVVKEPLPGDIIPDETFVLVGFCKNTDNIDGFYKAQGLYNFRMDDNKGSLEFTNEVVNAKYLLLWEPQSKEIATKIFKIKGRAPKVFSGKKLEKKGYKSKKLKEYYIVVEIEKVETSELGNISCDIKTLMGLDETNIYKPFTTTLTDLMENKAV